ncbi:hypothetical protein JJB27_03680 [Campylobacter fetus subsp. venerealis]|uniref:hypothetical protein n=1 Tax=Campylobacter fetus TaxID=196 RepID=UPI0008187A0A|nr:hypothetical protein [Campylobacter fetus]MBK3498177.1 hypothetical protein [Campylobacter fetus subsp. venerealis]MBK3502191.1 hypothetical protein [Campylobacter fetus subsp. venerealis]OCS16813.1 hypothetical protein CfvWBT01109_01895 [Campylobacter fetus subsp. venerealis]
MSKHIKKLYWLLVCSPAFLFGAGGGSNVLKTLTTSANQQITEAGNSLASIVNTVSIVFGVLWIIIMLLTAFFNIEAIKNHAKLIFGALVIIGIVYGLSAAAM